MIGHFQELDGTCFQMDIPVEFDPYEIRLPVYANPTTWLAYEGQVAMVPCPRPAFRRYKLVGTSGELAFYDRVIDMREFE